jgi:hypothetical protein
MRINGFDPTEEQVLRYETEAQRMTDAVTTLYEQVDRLSKFDADPIALRVGIDIVHANVHALAHVLEKNDLIGHGQFTEELIHQMSLFADDWDERVRKT